MRDEDTRPGSGNNLIDRSGRNPLSFGEREALAAQAKNRRLGDGNLPGDDDAARIRMASSDPRRRETASFQNLVEKHHDPLTRPPSIFENPEATHVSRSRR